MRPNLHKQRSEKTKNLTISSLALFGSPENLKLEVTSKTVLPCLKQMKSDMNSVYWYLENQSISSMLMNDNEAAMFFLPRNLPKIPVAFSLFEGGGECGII